MNSDIMKYSSAVEAIKEAVLKAQYAAAKATNAQQLQLYYAVGGYISSNTRKGAWGTGALKSISEQLQNELPGLRGFSERNMYYMKKFFEEWSSGEDVETMQLSNSALASAEIGTSNSALASAEIGKADIWNLQVQNCDNLSIEEFLTVSFTHHRIILESADTLEERVFYIHKCATEHLSVEVLKRSIKADDFNHQGKSSNNFWKTLPKSEQALRAISTFKDEYLLDFINVEELGVRDFEDIDERVLEQGIVQNIKKFIMTFGKGFSFLGNQYHLDAFGVDQYVDLLFFNRDLNCLVAVELKSGPFKSAYLGQLSGYLKVLDDFERRPHENAPVGLILCKDMNKAFVDYVIQDYNKPMGVATYKTSKDMSQELLQALPPIDDLKALLENSDEIE